MQQDSPLVLTEHPPDHPFRMQKPQKLRHILSQHGEISRLYLAPEGANSPYSSCSSPAHMPATCYLWCSSRRPTLQSMCCLLRDLQASSH